MRLLGSLSVVLFLVACGSSGPVATQPGGQASLPPGGQTQAPVATPGAPQPGGGDNEAKARALVPPGSTQVSTSSVGGNFSIVVSTPQTLEQLAAFYTTAIPAAGMTETGRFTLEGTLTIAFSNPEGGVVAFADPNAGSTIVTISVGTSS
jgi:hypothetical protein